MPITRRILTDLGVAAADADKYLPDLERLMPQHGIDSRLRIAHFLAQVLHESTRLKRVQENLKYRAERLIEVFKKYFTPQQAKDYAGNEEKIANRVYANRMGNGGEASGDGYRYRGRGLMQLTGKDNYHAFFKWLGVDPATNPDLVASQYAVHSAVYFWTKNKLNNLADRDDARQITKIVNGGLNGLDDRIALLHRAKQLLPAELVQQPAQLFTHAVTATSLNLRSRPQVSPATRICALAQGTKLVLLEDLTGEWSRVRAVLNGKIVEGYVSRKYLEPLPQPATIRTRAAVQLERPTHAITATRLNFRSEPVISPTTQIGVLDQGAKVEKIADGFGGWAQVRAVVGGKLKQGYVAVKYLQALPEAVAEATPGAAEAAAAAPKWIIPVVHLKENRPDITRQLDGGRAYPLGEANRPGRRGESKENRIQSIMGIITYLDSENPRHLRYQPKPSTTFCNIYAYDFCYLAGVYLPRVWWTDKALLQIGDDIDTPVLYDKTVRELNANALLDWLADHGSTFGWKRVVDLDLLQACANNGEICLIVAQRKNPNESGHITVVAPESELMSASRNAAGEVLRPVESQAGRQNHRLVVKPSKWWLASGFRNYAFWRHG